MKSTKYDYQQENRMDGEAPKQAELPHTNKLKSLSHLSFLPFFRTARNHHLQTKQQTKPWDKMMQHVTSCLKRSKQIHYCKW